MKLSIKLLLALVLLNLSCMSQSIAQINHWTCGAGNGFVIALSFNI